MNSMLASLLFTLTLFTGAIAVEQDPPDALKSFLKGLFNKVSEWTELTSDEIAARVEPAPTKRPESVPCPSNVSPSQACTAPLDNAASGEACRQCGCGLNLLTGKEAHPQVNSERLDRKLRTTVTSCPIGMYTLEGVQAGLLHSLYVVFYTLGGADGTVVAAIFSMLSEYLASSQGGGNKGSGIDGGLFFHTCGYCSRVGSTRKTELVIDAYNVSSYSS
ncbi:hypothetical protein SELMODRAFT_425467 [Selaginella moellendorffii]|uniref:Uncharacterized protein n=1 Tax=Selaginella moellendorffii TaxID=88036 RepID=D8ST69_SELML|nr:hypothetical protein SELMODRAFT_425467 [Selaginella moellendorffii]